jgi:hypothetical protein
MPAVAIGRVRIVVHVIAHGHAAPRGVTPGPHGGTVGHEILTDWLWEKAHHADVCVVVSVAFPDPRYGWWRPSVTGPAARSGRVGPELLLVVLGTSASTTEAGDSCPTVDLRRFGFRLSQGEPTSPRIAMIAITTNNSMSVNPDVPPSGHPGIPAATERGEPLIGLAGSAHVLVYSWAVEWTAWPSPPPRWRRHPLHPGRRAGVSACANHPSDSSVAGSRAGSPADGTDCRTVAPDPRGGILVVPCGGSRGLAAGSAGPTSSSQRPQGR